MDDPDMGEWYYEYEPVGNLKRQTDARGCVSDLELRQIQPPDQQGLQRGLQRHAGYDVHLRPGRRRHRLAHGDERRQRQHLLGVR